MRTTSSQHGARRLLLTTALALPLSVLLLGAPASAAGPAAGGPAPAAQANAAPHSAAAGDSSSAGASSGSSSDASSSSSSSSSSTGADEQRGQASSSDAAPAKRTKSSSSGKAASGASGKAAEPKPDRTAPAAAQSGSKGAGSSGSTKGTSGTTASPQPLSGADRNGTGANPGDSCTHAYCSTRDGKASGNGNGDGKAGGKPCAGCVGKADNKFPKGQAVNGKDANNGYECDGNTGIARTNPAHTGCKTVVTACVPTPTNPCTPPPPPCVPTADKPCTPPVCVDTAANPCTPPVCVDTAANPCTPPGCVETAQNPCTPDTPRCVPTLEQPCRPSTPVCPTGDVSGPRVAACEPVRVLPLNPGPSITNLRPVPNEGVLSSTLVRSAVQARTAPAALPFTGGEALLLGQVAAAALVLGVAAVRLGRRRTAVR